MGDDGPGKSTARNRSSIFQISPQRHVRFCSHHQGSAAKAVSGCWMVLRGLGRKSGAVHVEKRREWVGYSENERSEQHSRQNSNLSEVFRLQQAT